MSRSILIVAAERGLGLGLAREFFDRGWSVTGTARPGADTGDLEAIGRTDPSRLSLAFIDVTDPDQVEPFVASLTDRRFDVIYFNAGIYGPLHQSVTEATDAEFAEIMLTNTFGPIRLAHRLLDRLTEGGGTYAFMSSHRGSTAINLEGGLELYRASKAALNMLARGLWAINRNRGPAGLTVLSIHRAGCGPPWARLTARSSRKWSWSPAFKASPKSSSATAVPARTSTSTGGTPPSVGERQNLRTDHQGRRTER